MTIHIINSKSNMRYYSRLLIYTFLALFISQTIKAQTLHILPLGNSITQSDNEHLSYRYALWKKLIDDGLDFEFVGHLTSHNGGVPVYPPYEGQNFDQDHEGHWGWQADQLVNGLPNWLPGYTPDIVLLHIGTNDLFLGDGSASNIAETITEIDSIISLLRDDNPNVLILLAKIIPSTNSLLINKIPDFNQAIPQVATDMYDPDSPIIIVDQFEGFDAVTDTFDGVHPNETGEEKMAQKWRDAIVQAISSGIRLNLKLFLEGPFNGLHMDTSLVGLLPLQQPYNMPPWNYSGNEQLTSVPFGCVGWVLVELRDTTNVALADSATFIAKKACLLKFDGTIVNVQGSADLTFDADVSDSLFVVVYHRNHLSVISANPLIENSGVFTWDFSDDAGKAFGGVDALKELSPSNYGLYSGDFDGNGFIDNDDYISVWYNHAGKSGLLMGDSNLDGKVGNKDKNDYWYTNRGQSSQVP